MTTILVRHAAKNLQKNKKSGDKTPLWSHENTILSDPTRLSVGHEPAYILLFAEEESAKRVFEAG
jgi:hypothetical protein